MMNVGIILPNWIGDVVMSTPTLRALGRHYGRQAALVGIMRPYVSQVLAGTSWLNQTIWYDRRARDPALRIGAVAQKLRRLRLDTMILLTNSFSSGVLAWLSGARRRVGYVRNGRGLLLTHKLYPPRTGRRLVPISAVDYYLGLACAVGCAPERKNLELATLEKDERTAGLIWDKLGLSASRRVVVLNTGGAYGAAKHWPVEYWTGLARQIVSETDAAVLVLCGPAERETAGWIERRAAHPRVKSMAHQDQSLGVAKACVRRSQLMVTTDSGPRHFAAAFDVPVITLFGPIDPAWSETYHPQAIHLRRQLPCSPCGRRVCPLGHHRCMRDLTAGEVFQAVLRQLETADANQAA